MKIILISGFLLIMNLTFSQNQMDTTNELKLLLKEISIQAIKLGDFHFLNKQIDSNWIGYEPASNEDIEKLEKRLGISLPQEFIEFLKITNGFQAANGVEPSFCSTDKIDFLKNVDADLYEIWVETGNLESGNKMKTAIKVGGYDEEQYFFLIPPSDENKNWEYWVFAAWAPGETVYNSMQEYFLNVLETTNMLIEK